MARRKRLSRPPAEPIGERLALLRKERGITQVELASQLGVPQANISRYEHAQLRLHGSLIVQAAQILGVTADELLGLTPVKANGVHNRQIARRLRMIDRLNRRDQQALLRTINAYLAKAEAS